MRDGSNNDLMELSLIIWKPGRPVTEQDGNSASSATVSSSLIEEILTVMSDDKLSWTFKSWNISIINHETNN